MTNAQQHKDSSPDNAYLANPTSDFPVRPKPPRPSGRFAGFLAAHKLLLISTGMGVVIASLAVVWLLTSISQEEALSSLRHQLASAQSKISSQQSALSRDASQQDALKEAQDQLKEDQAKLAADQATLKSGQDALAAQTQLVQASQFSDGQYIVGQTLTPGVYHETAGGDCYYEWSSSTASDASIVSNDIPDGPATVTLRPGDIFNSSDCGTWTKIG